MARLHQTFQEFLNTGKAVSICVGRKGSTSIPLLELLVLPVVPGAQVTQCAQRDSGFLLSVWSSVAFDACTRLVYIYDPGQ